MTFQDQMQSDLENVFFNSDEFSTAAIYTHAGGDAVTIQVLFFYGMNSDTNSIETDGLLWTLPVEKDFRSNFKNGGARHVATVVVMASDISAPGYGDTIEIDDVIWTVREVFADA